MDKRDELIKKLLIGLKEAKNSIRTLYKLIKWHSMGAKGFEEEAIWKIYDTHSPEMKRLNALIEETESKIASLKDEIEKEKTNKSDELKYEFGADNIFNEIDTNL